MPEASGFGLLRIKELVKHVMLDWIVRSLNLT